MVLADEAVGSSRCGAMMTQGRIDNAKGRSGAMQAKAGNLE